MPKRKALLQGGCGIPESGVYERDTVTGYNVKPRTYVKKSY